MGLDSACLNYCVMGWSPARRENTDLSIILLIIIGRPRARAPQSVCARGYLRQELISHATNCSKVFGTGRFGFQFLAQPQNVVVDRASRRITPVSPHFIQKLIPRDHSSCILEEIG